MLSYCCGFVFDSLWVFVGFVFCFVLVDFFGLFHVFLVYLCCCDCVSSFVLSVCLRALNLALFCALSLCVCFALFGIRCCLLVGGCCYVVSRVLVSLGSFHVLCVFALCSLFYSIFVCVVRLMRGCWCCVGAVLLFCCCFVFGWLWVFVGVVF